MASVRQPPRYSRDARPTKFWVSSFSASPEVSRVVAMSLRTPENTGHLLQLSRASGAIPGFD